jgi:hypothetical protein
MYVYNGLPSYGHIEFRMLSVIIKKKAYIEKLKSAPLSYRLLSPEVIFKITALTLLHMKTG